MNDLIKNNLPAVCAAATVIAFLYAAREFLIIQAGAFAAVSLAAAIVVAVMSAYRLKGPAK
jgi:hypothetical protein